MAELPQLLHLLRFVHATAPACWGAGQSPIAPDSKEAIQLIGREWLESLTAETDIKQLAGVLKAKSIGVDDLLAAMLAVSSTPQGIRSDFPLHAAAKWTAVMPSLNLIAQHTHENRSLLRLASLSMIQTPRELLADKAAVKKAKTDPILIQFLSLVSEAADVSTFEDSLSRAALLRRYQQLGENFKQLSDQLLKSPRAFRYPRWIALLESLRDRTTKPEKTGNVQAMSELFFTGLKTARLKEMMHALHEELNLLLCAVWDMATARSFPKMMVRMEQQLRNQKEIELDGKEWWQDIQKFYSPPAAPSAAAAAGPSLWNLDKKRVNNLLQLLVAPASSQLRMKDAKAQWQKALTSDPFVIASTWVWVAFLPALKGDGTDTEDLLDAHKLIDDARAQQNLHSPTGAALLQLETFFADAATAATKTQPADLLQYALCCLDELVSLHIQCGLLPDGTPFEQTLSEFWRSQQNLVNGTFQKKMMCSLPSRFAFEFFLTQCLQAVNMITDLKGSNKDLTLWREQLKSDTTGVREAFEELKKLYDSASWRPIRNFLDHGDPTRDQPQDFLASALPQREMMIGPCSWNAIIELRPAIQRVLNPAARQAVGTSAAASSAAAQLSSSSATAAAVSTVAVAGSASNVASFSAAALAPASAGAAASTTAPAAAQPASVVADAEMQLAQLLSLIQFQLDKAACGKAKVNGNAAEALKQQQICQWHAQFVQPWTEKHVTASSSSSSSSSAGVASASLSPSTPPTLQPSYDPTQLKPIEVAMLGFCFYESVAHFVQLPWREVKRRLLSRLVALPMERRATIVMIWQHLYPEKFPNGEEPLSDDEFTATVTGLYGSLDGNLGDSLWADQIIVGVVADEFPAYSLVVHRADYNGQPWIASDIQPGAQVPIIRLLQDLDDNGMPVHFRPLIPV